jgi:TRAP-type C4-dicarboxylate transport system permease small subunit
MTDIPTFVPGADIFVQKLATAKMVLAGVFLVLMMVHVGADTFMKMMLNSPIIGTLETVSYYYMVSIVFLPLAFVEVRNEHVAVDLFVQRLPNVWQVIVYLFGATISVLYYGVFCYQTTVDAIKATSEQETVMSNFLFYVWPSRWALPLGSAALIAAIILNMLKCVVTGNVPEIADDRDIIE